MKNDDNVNFFFFKTHAVMCNLPLSLSQYSVTPPIDWEKSTEPSCSSTCSPGMNSQSPVFVCVVSWMDFYFVLVLESQILMS